MFSSCTRSIKMKEKSLIITISHLIHFYRRVYINIKLLECISSCAQKWRFSVWDYCRYFQHNWDKRRARRTNIHEKAVKNYVLLTREMERPRVMVTACPSHGLSWEVRIGLTRLNFLKLLTKWVKLRWDRLTLHVGYYSFLGLDSWRIFNAANQLLSLHDLVSLREKH